MLNSAAFSVVLASQSGSFIESSNFQNIIAHFCQASKNVNTPNMIMPRLGKVRLDNVMLG